MERHSPEQRDQSPEQEQRELILDSETLRSEMKELWHDDVDLKKIRKQVYDDLEVLVKEAIEEYDNWF